MPEPSELERAFLFTAKAVGLPAPEQEYRFGAPIGRRWRFDFAWPEAKVALEIEGGGWVQGRHTRGAGLEADIEKYNMAGLLGWLVIRATGAMVRDGRAVDITVAALTTRGNLMADWEVALDKQLDGWLIYNTPKGQRYIDNFLADVAAKYPDNVENSKIMLRAVPEHLWRADPIYVSPDMMTLLEAAWPTYEPEPLYPEDLIVPSGFVWLPRPIYTNDVRGVPMAHRAILWGPATSIDGHPGILLATFADPADPDPGAEAMEGIDPVKYRAGTMRYFGGAPMLGHVTTRWFGKDYTEQEGQDIVVGLNSTMDIDPDQALVAMTEVEQVMGAMWRLLSQRIAVGMRATPSRAQRKRAWPHQFEPKYITVITLRRPKTAPGDEHHAVDWTHRWIVGAHWRWQPYPSEGIRRQIWIAPYVKGPADLPLVVRGARVFTLRR